MMRRPLILLCLGGFAVLVWLTIYQILPLIGLQIPEVTLWLQSNNAWLDPLANALGIAGTVISALAAVFQSGSQPTPTMFTAEAPVKGSTSPILPTLAYDPNQFIARGADAPNSNPDKNDKYQRVFRDMRKTGGVLLLKGPTGRGKTWLLGHFAYLCRQDRTPVASIDFFGGQYSNLAELLAALAVDLKREWFSVHRLWNWYSTNSRNEFQRALDRYHQIRTDQGSRAEQEAKHQLVARFWAYVKITRTPTVIMIDSFEKASDLLEIEISEFLLKPILQGDPKDITLVITGWQTPKLPSVLSDSLKILDVEGFKPLEIERYVKKRLNVTLSETGLRKILSTTGTTVPVAGQRPDDKASNPLYLRLLTDLVSTEVTERHSANSPDATVDDVLSDLNATSHAEVAKQWVEQLQHRISSEDGPLTVDWAVVEASAIPHFIESDTVRVIAGVDPVGTLQAMKNFWYHDKSFDKQRYHEEVRGALLRYLQAEGKAARYHEKAALHYFRIYEQKLGIHDLSGRQAGVEAFYHYLWVDDTKARQCLEALWQQCTQFDARYEKELLEALYKTVFPVQGVGWKDVPDHISLLVQIPILLGVAKVRNQIGLSIEAARAYEQIETLLKNHDYSLLQAADHLLQCQCNYGIAAAYRWTDGTDCIQRLRAAEFLASLLPHDASGTEFFIQSSPVRLEDIHTLQADIYRLWGAYDQAITFGAKAYQSSNHDVSRKHRYGRILVLAGNIADGIRTYDEIFAHVVGEVEEPRRTSYLFTHLAEAFFLMGSFDVGARWAQDALRWSTMGEGVKEWPKRHGVALWNNVKGRVGRITSGAWPHIRTTKQENWSDIYREIEEAIDLQDDYKFGVGWMRLDYARALMYGGRYGDALTCLQHALKDLVEIGSWHKVVEALLLLAYIWDTHCEMAQDEWIAFVAKIEQLARGEITHAALRGIVAVSKPPCVLEMATNSLPEQPLPWFFDSLSDVHLLLTLHYSKGEATHLIQKEFQRACQLAICHSPYALRRCLLHAKCIGVDIDALQRGLEDSQPESAEYAQIQRIWTLQTPMSAESFLALLQHRMRHERERLLFSPYGNLSPIGEDVLQVLNHLQLDLMPLLRE